MPAKDHPAWAELDRKVPNCPVGSRMDLLFQLLGREERCRNHVVYLPDVRCCRAAIENCRKAFLPILGNPAGFQYGRYEL